MRNNNIYKTLQMLIIIFSITVFIGCNLTAKSAAKNDNIEIKNESTPKPSPTVDAKLFNINLIKNGDAETGNSSGWTNAEDNLKTFRYDGGWGDAWQVTPPNHGDSYFYAKVSKDAPIAEFTQKTDVSKIALEIDANKVSYNLDSWYGVRGAAGARLIAAFYGADGTQIKNSKDEADATEKFTSENRPSDTEMVEKTHSGQIPVGTRSIKITLEFRLFEVHPDNEGDTALTDNLSLVLTNKGDN